AVPVRTTSIPADEVPEPDPLDAVALLVLVGLESLPEAGEDLLDQCDRLPVGGILVEVSSSRLQHPLVCAERLLELISVHCHARHSPSPLHRVSSSEPRLTRV